MQTLITTFRAWQARRSMLKDYRKKLEVYKLLQAFITQQIISNDSDPNKKGGWRQQLVNTQNHIKADEEMIKFLENL